MCDRRGWHEAGNEIRRLSDGLTLSQKCQLHLALVRDYHPTLGETLAKFTAEREAQRERIQVAALPGLTIVLDEGQEPGTATLVGADGQRITMFNIGTHP